MGINRQEELEAAYGSVEEGLAHEEGIVSERDIRAIATWSIHDQGDDPGRVEDFKRMACCDHVCRQCKHAWFSNTNDQVCELCGGDDIQDIFDESPEDTE